MPAEILQFLNKLYRFTLIEIPFTSFLYNLPILTACDFLTFNHISSLSNSLQQVSTMDCRSHREPYRSRRSSSYTVQPMNRLLKYQGTATAAPNWILGNLTSSHTDQCLYLTCGLWIVLAEVVMSVKWTITFQHALYCDILWYLYRDSLRHAYNVAITTSRNLQSERILPWTQTKKSWNNLKMTRNVTCFYFTCRYILVFYLLASFLRWVTEYVGPAPTPTPKPGFGKRAAGLECPLVTHHTDKKLSETSVRVCWEMTGESEVDMAWHYQASEQVLGQIQSQFFAGKRHTPDR